MNKKDSARLYTLLLSIRNELLRYHTKSCNLAHEKVTAVTVQPVLENETSGITYTFSRAGFCTAESRKWQLNCAHSMAAANFNFELAKLENTGLLFPGKLPIPELNQVLTEIYLLDHQIGEVEKRLALLLYTGEKESNLSEIEALLNGIKKKHQTLVASLHAHHQKIIFEIDALLREMQHELLM